MEGKAAGVDQEVMLAGTQRLLARTGVMAVWVAMAAT
jgi:hypothetical protein